MKKTMGIVEMRILAAERAEYAQSIGMTDLAERFADARSTLITLWREGYVRSLSGDFLREVLRYQRETGDFSDVRLSRCRGRASVSATRRGVRQLAGSMFIN